MAVTLAVVDDRIAALAATLKRTRENLADLDDDVTRRTLDASPSLVGATAVARTDARARFSDLWRGQLALDDLLQELVRVRGPRASVPRPTLGRLVNMLDGPSVTTAPPGDDNGVRALTDGLQPSVDRTIEDVLSRMSADYEVVAAVVSDVTAVWLETLPQLASLTSTVTALEALVASTGIRTPNELTAARRAIAAAEEQGGNDPLALGDDTVASISELIDRARAVLRDVEAGRLAVADDLAAATTVVAACEEALRRGQEEVRQLALKIAVPESVERSFQQAEEDVARLHREIAAGREVQHRAVPTPPQAAELRGRATALLDHIRGIGAEGDAGLEARNELRGRLDAYRAKARAHGLSEDIELHQLDEAATVVLYSAPCDLRQAEALVAAYQHAVRSAAGEGA